MTRNESMRVVMALRALHVPHVVMREPGSRGVYHVLVRVPEGDVVLSELAAAEKWCVERWR